MVASGRRITGSVVIIAAGGVLLVRQQPPDVLGLVGLHQRQQLLGGLRRQLGDQVGRVVRRHLLEHVGGPLVVEVAEDLDLVLLGQLLEHVGQPLVVERRDHLAPPLRRQVVDHVAASAGRMLVERVRAGGWRPGRLGVGQARRPRSTRRRGSGPCGEAPWPAPAPRPG